MPAAAGEPPVCIAYQVLLDTSQDLTALVERVGAGNLSMLSTPAPPRLWPCWLSARRLAVASRYQRRPPGAPRASDPDLTAAAPRTQAYGTDGLGVLTVSGVPGFAELRRQLLPLAERIAVRGAPGGLGALWAS
jgi:hypothetical protein